MGEHPIYILVYGILVVSGAGSALSVDAVLQRAWAAWRRARPAPMVRRAPAGSAWTAPVSMNALIVYFVAGTLIALAIGFGLLIAIPAAPTGSGSGTPTPTAYLNLTINIDPVNGYPYYTPANFTVPVGLIEVTIVDNDAPVNWSACPCSVGGTVGGIEYVNGTAVGDVPNTNVAHTFNIPVLGLQVLSPGQSTVQFLLEVDHPGQYTWYCFAPCGTGADPYNTPPMGVAGLMTGTMTVG